MTAASGFSSESAITAKVTPAIAATPAARPSIPSRKLTMFMIATIQTIVSGTPSQAGSAWMPMNGSVKRSTQIPKPVGIAAATSCPPSFSYQRRPRKSSIAPTVTATAAPSSRPRVLAADVEEGERRERRCRGRARGRRAAGSELRFSRRPPGSSTTPSIRAIPPTAGVSRTTTTNATSAPQTTCRWSPRTWRTLWWVTPTSRTMATTLMSPIYFVP